jgi:DNA-binding response OmpR family regulator
MNRILLVDDEHLIISSLSTSLKADGHAVTLAGTGIAALSKLAVGNFDVCFLDVDLPDANGLDLMKLFRERSPRTGIVIMTALDLTDRQLAEIRALGCKFLPKPFDLENVRELITELQVNRTGETVPGPS